MLDTPDEDYEDEETLPPALLILTSPDLDHDEETNRRAGNRVDGLLRGLLDQLETFEEVDQALSRSADVSARARKARAQIRDAIVGFEKVIGPTSNACDVFAKPVGWSR